MVLAEPSLQISAHKSVVVEMRIGRVDAVDFLLLSRSERFSRVEAPDAFQQPLPVKNLMAPGDDAMKVVGHIEDRRIAVGHLRVKLEQIAADGAGGDRGVNPTSNSTARFTHTLQWPSRPPWMRMVVGWQFALSVNGVIRSMMI